MEGCGALVFPEMFGLAQAHQTFESGRLRDPTLAERLAKDVAGFVRLAEAASGICGERATGQARQHREKIVAALEKQSTIHQAGAS